MRGIEVLDQNEGYAAIGRLCIEKFLEGIETAGGSADADHWEITRFAWHGAQRRNYIVPDRAAACAH